MTKGAVGETLWKGQKKERQVATKRCQETDKKKAGKLVAAHGKNAEISAWKVLKICKMPQTECSKMLRKYKSWIYYRIY